MDQRKQSMKIALLGTRGVPASYSGFETCVEQLGKRLAQRGHHVTVYCRSHHITHRDDAIFYGYTSQMPPSESTVLQSLGNAPLLLKMLRHDIGDASVSDVYIDLTFGGLLAHCVVAMTPAIPATPSASAA